MRLWLSRIVMPRDSGIPQDASINDFYFFSDVGTPASDDAVANSLQVYLNTFYNDDTTASGISIASRFSNAVSRATDAVQIVVYAKDTLDPAVDWGPPVEIRDLTFVAAAAAPNLPSETAACLSFHGDLTGVPETADNPTPPPAKIRPAARRRGRVYLGPLIYGALVDNAGVNYDPLLGSNFVNTVAEHAAGLADDSGGAWVVYSPTSQAVFPVVGGYVDNALDTQRRRGRGPTSRTSWTA